MSSFSLLSSLRARVSGARCLAGEVPITRTWGQLPTNPQQGTKVLSPTAHEEPNSANSHMSLERVLPQLSFEMRSQCLLTLIAACELPSSMSRPLTRSSWKLIQVCFNPSC